MRKVFFMEDFIPESPQSLSDGFNYDISGMDFQELNDLWP
jgi:hypothetical protein